MRSLKALEINYLCINDHLVSPLVKKVLSYIPRPAPFVEPRFPLRPWDFELELSAKWDVSDDVFQSLLRETWNSKNSLQGSVKLTFISNEGAEEKQGFLKSCVYPFGGDSSASVRLMLE